MKGRPDEKLTAREIASWVFEAYPAECQAKRARSPDRLRSDEDLVQQMVAEVGSQYPRIRRRNNQFKTTEDRPRRYYFTEQSDDDAIEQSLSAGSVSTPEQSEAWLEKDLYPLLTEYLWSEHGVYSKRIDEKRGSNRRGPNGNRWLYPDVVGMENLGVDWHREVRDCVSQYGDRRIKLWSFEVKLVLNRSNVRECFFQTVSNSSWANFGYLVAQNIDHAATRELRMLAAAHGIGVVQLNAENPAESQILIPARERDVLDWDMMNRLATENPDFMDYVKVIKQFHQTGEARLVDWDTREPVDD